MGFLALVEFAKSIVSSVGSNAAAERKLPPADTGGVAAAATATEQELAVELQRTEPEPVPADLGREIAAAASVAAEVALAAKPTCVETNPAFALADTDVVRDRFQLCRLRSHCNLRCDGGGGGDLSVFIGRGGLGLRSGRQLCFH